MHIQFLLFLFITLLLGINSIDNIRLIHDMDQNKIFVNRPKDGNPDYFYAPIWMHKSNLHGKDFYFFIEQHKLTQIDNAALENSLQKDLSNALLNKNNNYCFEGENGIQFDLKNAQERCFLEVKNAPWTLKDIQRGINTSMIHHHHDLLMTGPMLIFATEGGHFYYISDLQEIWHLNDEEVRTFFIEKSPKKEVEVEENERKKRKRNEEGEEMPTAKRIRIDEGMPSNSGNGMEIVEVATIAHSLRSHAHAHMPRSPKSQKANFGISRRKMYMANIETEASIKEGVLLRNLSGYNPVIHKFIGPDSD